MTAVTAPGDKPASELDTTAARAVAAPRSRRNTVLGALGVLAVTGGGAYHLATLGRVSTDDAQIDASIVAVPARAAGTVEKLFFTDNQSVRTGDLLASLDAAAARARLAQAEANLAAAEAAAEAARADAIVTERVAVGNRAAANALLRGAYAGTAAAGDQRKEAEAALRAAEARLEQAKVERGRAKQLGDSAAISAATVDASETELQIAQANVDAARARLATLAGAIAQASSHVSEASARAEQSSDVPSLVAQAAARRAAAEAGVAVAKATRDLAALDLSYTEIRAPHDGVVSRKTIAEGQAVSAGQPIVQLVTPGVWITANFKETQLEQMRVHQAVTFHVDAYPSAVLHGEVESFSGATGSRFALLPPDNASGNFTKVVQRVPVRVRVTAVPREIVLRPGMSVDVTVDTRG